MDTSIHWSLFIYLFLDKQSHVPKVCSPFSVSVPVSTLLCLWTLLLPISEHPPNLWTYLCDKVIRNALFQIIRNDWFIWWHIFHVILQANAASVLYLYHFNVKLWEILCPKYLWDWLMFFQMILIWNSILSLAASVRLCSALAQEAISQRFRTLSLSPIALVRTGIRAFSQSILWFLFMEAEVSVT